MHELITSPFLGDYIVTRPDSERGVKIPHLRYLELDSAASSDLVPAWLTDAARRCWGLDLAGRKVHETVLVRKESPYRFGRASYELNLGCNYDCEHCYLGLSDSRGRRAALGRSDR